MAQAEIDSAIAAQRRAEAKLNLAYVRAPINSQVLKIHTRPGEVVSSNGIVELGQTDRMYTVAEIYETDIKTQQSLSNIDSNSCNVLNLRSFFYE